MTLVVSVYDCPGSGKTTLGRSLAVAENNGISADLADPTRRSCRLTTNRAWLIGRIAVDAYAKIEPTEYEVRLSPPRTS